MGFLGIGGRAGNIASNFVKTGAAFVIANPKKKLGMINSEFQDLTGITAEKKKLKDAADALNASLNQKPPEDQPPTKANWTPQGQSADMVNQEQEDARRKLIQQLRLGMASTILGGGSINSLSNSNISTPTAKAKLGQ